MCNVYTQTGCPASQRCTYADTGSGFGVACEPMGTAAAGSACTTDPTTHLDNCVAGTVCGGTCKPVCDPQGSGACGSGSVCDTYSRGTGADVGACDRLCDPLADNDFDGPAPTHTKSGAVCTAPMQGCYGVPSSGPKPTAFTCINDVNYSAQLLHHRVACTASNDCASSSGGAYVNGCNQGYLPLLTDSTGSTTAVCIALCSSLNCSQGDCGAGNANQLGAAPHRCNSTDALGTFNTAVTGEECTFWWIDELGMTGNLVRSPYSDSLGFCFDHSKYMYDSNGDGTPDSTIPPCSSLPLGGGGTAPDAASFGCVDTAHAGLPAHAPRRLLDLRFPSSVHP